LPLLEGQEKAAQESLERAPLDPYRITGGIPLLQADGTPLARNEGASLDHYSLCRCGHSQNKPFCSGMHWYVGFADPPPPSGREPTLFEWAGGFPALTRMTRLFYERYVPEDPPARAAVREHGARSPGARRRLAGRGVGGPKAYSERYGGYNQMVSQHLGRCLREEQRARWVELICRSADDAGLPDDAEFRAAFVGYIEWGSRIAKRTRRPARPHR
jgi:truncated hemoglobin YjbI/CDGSH-type Zn-finger protein